MKVLIDTDAFCKLAAGGVLTQVLAAAGLGRGDAGRLAALPHMLRRGSLARRLGSDICEQIMPLVQSIEPAPAADPEWLDLVAPLHGVDLGEAELLAAAAQHGLLLLTGDKRALRAIRHFRALVDALAGRVMTIEASLLRLCQVTDEESVRESLAPIVGLDTMFRVCFSAGTDSPARALMSYHAHAREELAPLILWEP